MKQISNINLEEQYNSVLSNIHHRSKEYDINELEKIFIKKFLEKLISLEKKRLDKT